MAVSLECPSCGAPVRWQGEAHVVECRYCGQRVLTDSWQPTEEPAVVRSRVRPRNQALAVLIPLAMVLLMGGLSMFITVVQQGSVSGGPLGMSRVDQATLGAVSLASSPEAYAAALGLSPSTEDHVLAYLNGMGFNYAAISWDEDHPGCATSISLHTEVPHPNAANIEAWLEFYLGRRLEHQDKGRLAYSWQSVYLWFDEDRTILGLHVDPDTDPDWQYRMQLLWSVLLASIAGQDLHLDDTILRDWLGWGYTLGSLAQFDPTTTIDQVRARLPSLFPGAIEDRSSSLNYEIPLAHPWFGLVGLSWNNEQGGLLRSVTFWPPTGLEALADQTAVRRCVGEMFGQPTTRELDHLEGTWYANWEPAGLNSVSVYPNLMSVDVVRHGHKVTPRVRATWRRLLTGLQSCVN